MVPVSFDEDPIPSGCTSSSFPSDGNTGEDVMRYDSGRQRLCFMLGLRENTPHTGMRHPEGLTIAAPPGPGDAHSGGLMAHPTTPPKHD
jgi:hypothetical protein